MTDEPLRSKRRRRRLAARLRAKGDSDPRDPDLAWMVVAALGALVLLWSDLVQSWPVLDRQSRLWWMFFGLIPVVWAAARFVTPVGYGLLRDRLRLVVPLVLAQIAFATIGWIAAWRAFAWFALETWRFAFVDWSLHFLLLVAVVLLQVAWSTLLVQRSVADEETTLGEALRDALPLVPRATLCCVLGWGALLIPFGALLAVMDFALWMLVPIGLLAVVVNFTTAPLLLVALDDVRPWREAVGGALRVGLVRWREYWLVLVVRLLLLGLVTYVAVEFGTAGRTTSSTKFGVQAFWTGGYESECRWLGEYAAALKVEVPALLTRLSGLLFAVFALVCHLEIAHRLGGDLPGVEGDEEPEPEPEPRATGERRPTADGGGLLAGWFGEQSRLDADERRRRRKRRRRREADQDESDG